MKSKRRISLAFLILITLAMFLSGCTNYFAQRLVEAPNHRSLTKWSGTKSKDLDRWGIDQELEIKSGSPEITLSVWVIGPKNGWIAVRGRKGEEASGKWIDKIKKKYPDIKIPKTMVWRKYPKDPNTASLFNFFHTDDPNVVDEIGPVEAKGTVVLLHGLGMSKLEIRWWGHVLAAHGYRTVLVDLRGHGKSGGQYITYGDAESEDVSRVIDYLEQENLAHDRLIVMGWSYGAAIAIQTAAFDDRIDAVVALEPYTSLREAIPSFAKKQFGLLTLFACKETFDNIIDEAGDIANFDPDENTPIEAITKCDTPVLLIHGKNDEHIPYQHSEQLHNAAKEHSKLVVMGDINHLTLGTVNIYALRDEIVDWLDDN